jgi:hypothetical protein
MKIAPEGFATIAVAFLLAAAALTAWFFWRGPLLLYLALGFSIVFLFMVYFFRPAAAVLGRGRSPRRPTAGW